MSGLETIVRRFEPFSSRQVRQWIRVRITLQNALRQGFQRFPLYTRFDASSRGIGLSSMVRFYRGSNPRTHANVPALRPSLCVIIHSRFSEAEFATYVLLCAALLQQFNDLVAGRILQAADRKLKQRCMVPIVGLTCGNTPFNGVGDNGNEAGRAGGRAALSVPSGDGIDARISVAPIGLETAYISANRLVEQPAREQ